MIKKISLCVLFALCVSSATLFADSKEYVDYDLGYKGQASITYICEEESRDAFFENARTDMIELYEENGWKYRFTSKFTKEEDWLVWKALGEYDYRDNEVYRITGISSNKQLFDIYVRVWNEGTSLNFVSAYID